MKQTWQKKPKKTQHFLLKFYFLQKSYSIKSSLDSELSPKAEQNYKKGTGHCLSLRFYLPIFFFHPWTHTLHSHSQQCYHSCHSAIPSLGAALHNHERGVPHTFSCFWVSLIHSYISQIILENRSIVHTTVIIDITELSFRGKKKQVLFAVFAMWVIHFFTVAGKVLANVVRNVTHSTLDLFGPA